MIKKPVFRQGFHVEIVEPEGVFLLSERGHCLLRGSLSCQVARLLDGAHTPDDVVDELYGTVSAAEIYYALHLLEEKGYVVEAEASGTTGPAAFWEALGLRREHTESPMEQATVSVTVIGAVPADSFQKDLSAVGVHIAASADFAVVLTDDYLREDLAAFNTHALVSHRPWMLAKPVGSIIWVGPAFYPGITACWECLAQRLRANREVESYLQRTKQLTTAFVLPAPTSSATVRLGLQLTALETSKALTRDAESPPGTEVMTLDLLTLEAQRHAVVRRPECPSCGNPGSPARKPAPLLLMTCKKRFTDDGGHRASRPDETVAHYAHHVSPITGAVSTLTRASPTDEPLMHVYVSGQYCPSLPDSAGLLLQGLRAKSGGKGASDAQAKASALCEALERYSGNFRGDETRRPGTYRELGSHAVHPNACMLFSEHQYRNRAQWNARGSRYQRVPLPFDEDANIEWTPIWSLTHRDFKYLPTSYCYYGYPRRRGGSYCWADSNGIAAGNTLEEAVLQGVLELVERDAVAMWWYNRVRRPRVDLSSFGDPYIERLQARFQELDHPVWVLDLTTDLGIPVFAAVSARTGGHGSQIMLGFGAHLDARVGVLRALTELNQFAAFSRTLDAGAENAYPDPAFQQWWETASLAEHPYLLPEGTAQCRSDYPLMTSEDLLEDVVHCQQVVESQGMEVLLLDQTRADIALPVVKVIIPGLRHFWARLAPGRLYDVPPKLGWLDRGLREDELNPVAMFF